MSAWVISGHWRKSGQCPLYPRKRTSLAAISTFALMNSRFLNGVRTSLHMIDESSQLRHGLAATGIVKKHARQHRRERFQHAR